MVYSEKGKVLSEVLNDCKSDGYEKSFGSVVLHPSVILSPTAIILKVPYSLSFNGQSVLFISICDEVIYIIQITIIIKTNNEKKCLFNRNFFAFSLNY